MTQHRRTSAVLLVLFMTFGMTLAAAACSDDHEGNNWEISQPDAGIDARPEDDDSSSPRRPLDNCSNVLPPISQLNPEGGKASQFSLELGPTGCPHVTLYQDRHDFVGGLRYARWDGEEWQMERVADIGVSAEPNDLALDSSGRPSVAHEGADGRSIMYSRRDDSGQWHSEMVADLRPSSLLHAIDGAGRPVVVAIADVEGDFGPETKISYFLRSADGWRQEEVYRYGRGTNTLGDSLAFDSEGGAHLGIALARGGEGLFYSQRTENGSDAVGSWSREYLEDGAEAARLGSFALDKNDQPHFIYSSAQPDSPVVHVFRTDSGWQSEPIETLERAAAWLSALAFDPLGQLHAVYLDQPIDQDEPVLRHAVWDGQDWAIERVGTALSSDIALRIDPETGVIHMLAALPTEPSESTAPAVYFTLPINL